MKNMMKYACDNKFTEVYVCKKYQNRAWFEEVIAKIKWCSFVNSHGTLFCKIPILGSLIKLTLYSQAAWNAAGELIALLSHKFFPALRPHFTASS